MSLQTTCSRGAGSASAARRNSARRGFSLIELVIVVVIIGIIAAIAIPRMSRGSAGAADSALAQNLSVLRNALDMYQTEHNGAYPTGTGTFVAQQLLQYSDIGGTTSQTTKDTTTGIIYGPYLRTIPPMTVGQYKGATTISVSAVSNTPPSGGAGIAWLYNSADGTIAPNTGTTTADNAGKLYSSY